MNTILSASGEQPVSSLSNSTADVANAELVLDEISREVQSEGWHFNTDDDAPFTPAVGTGFIDLPANVVGIDLKLSDHPDKDVVQRGTRLYDRRARSYVFTSDIKAEVVYFLTFEELPEQARRYIAIRAARIFHDRYVGSETQHRFTAEDEQRARVTLESFNLTSADINLFRNNRVLSRLARRR